MVASEDRQRGPSGARRAASVDERGRAGDWPHTLESFTETAGRLSLTPTSLVLGAEVGTATIDEAERLQIAPGADVTRIRRVRLLDGIRTAVDHAVVPTSIAPALLETDFRTVGLYDALEGAGIRLGEADTVLEARSADSATRDALELEGNAPVLTIHQLVADEGDRPVLLSRVDYAGPRYRLRASFLRGVRPAG